MSNVAELVDEEDLGPGAEDEDELLEADQVAIAVRPAAVDLPLLIPVLVPVELAIGGWGEDRGLPGE